MKSYKTAAHIETTGYKEWPRLKEIAEDRFSPEGFEAVNNSDSYYSHFYENK